MPRRRNYNDPGHAHELTFSCYHRLPLLRAERTCGWLGEALQAARSSHDFDLWAYVLMPEHVHLVIWPRNAEYDIAAIRKAIKAPAAREAMRWLDKNSPDWSVRLTSRKRRRERYFWQPGGGYDRNVTEPTTLEKVIEYVHENPVRRGLVTQCWDWRWSSAASYYAHGESPISIDPIDPAWTC